MKEMWLLGEYATKLHVEYLGALIIPQQQFCFLEILFLEESSEEIIGKSTRSKDSLKSVCICWGTIHLTFGCASK